MPGPPGQGGAALRHVGQRCCGAAGLPVRALAAGRRGVGPRPNGRRRRRGGRPVLGAATLQGASTLCHELAGSVRLALPRNNAGGLRLTILPREGQSLAELGTALQGRGLQIRSALSDSADRRPLWPPEAGAEVGAQVDHGPQLQLRVSVEAGAPARLLREVAAALGADVTGSVALGDGGRAVTVQNLFEDAALLNGVAVLREGWEFTIEATHPSGLRELSAGLAAARAATGGEAAARRAAALERLTQREPRGAAAAAPLMQRLCTMRTEATALGSDRAEETAGRTVEWVEGALGEEPAVAAAALQVARADLKDRQASLERKDRPPETMDDGAWEAQKSKEAALLERGQELVAEAARVMADQADIAAVAAANQDMTAHFLFRAPPVTKNGGGRRDGAAAPGGGPASGGQQPAQSRRDVGGTGAAQAAAAAASSAKGGKGGKGGGKGRPPGGHDDYDDPSWSGGKGKGKGTRGDGGKARRRDDRGSDGDSTRAAGSAGHSCWVCSWSGKKGPATPQSLATHVAYKHGEAPYGPGEDKAAWEAKRQWSVQEVARRAKSRPGEAGWHIGQHQGAGRRGRGPRGGGAAAAARW